MPPIGPSTPSSKEQALDAPDLQSSDETAETVEPGAYHSPIYPQGLERGPRRAIEPRMQESLELFLNQFPQISVGIVRVFAALRTAINDELGRYPRNFRRLVDNLRMTIMCTPVVGEMKEWTETGAVPMSTTVRYELLKMVADLMRDHYDGLIEWEPMRELKVSVGSVLRPFLYQKMKEKLGKQARADLEDLISDLQNKVGKNRVSGKDGVQPALKTDDLSLTDTQRAQVERWYQAFRQSAEGVQFKSLKDEEKLIEAIYFALHNNDFKEALKCYETLEDLDPSYRFNQAHLGKEANKKADQVIKSKEFQYKKQGGAAKAVAAKAYFQAAGNANGQKKAGLLTRLALARADRAELKSGFLSLRPSVQKDYEDAMEDLKEALEVHNQPAAEREAREYAYGELQSTLKWFRAKCFTLIVGLSTGLAWQGNREAAAMIEDRIERQERVEQEGDLEAKNKVIGLYNEAIELYKAKKYQASYTKLNMVRALNPAMADIYSDLNLLEGMLLYQYRRYQLAVEKLQRSRSAHPTRHFFLARSHMRMADLKQARLAMAECERLKGNTTYANKLQQLGENDPNFANSLHSAGSGFELDFESSKSIHDLLVAEKFYEQALSLNPKDGDIISALNRVRELINQHNQ